MQKSVHIKKKYMFNQQYTMKVFILVCLKL